MNAPFRIMMTQTAKSDIQSIMNYTMVYLKNRPAGMRFYKQLSRELRALAHNPFAYRSVTFKFEHRDLRMKPFKKHKIFYLVESDKKLIYILHVLNDAIDWEYHLKRF